MASPFHLQHLPWSLFCGIPHFLPWVGVRELGIAEVTEPELGIEVVLSQGWVSNSAGSLGTPLGMEKEAEPVFPGFGSCLGLVLLWDRRKFG